MTPRPPQTDLTLPQRLVLFLYEQRWLLAIFLGALVVRLHWNLVVHPIGDYIYSDMNGYVTRAERMLREPFEPHEYSAFFPFGTHAMLAVLKKTLGMENYPAIGVFYALVGAAGVALAYCVARRASRFRIVAPAVGLFGIFYYPHFSLGGYLLSEVPFATCLMAALLYTLRLVDHGRSGDAWKMGLACGLGTLIRPQILISAALIGAYWIVRRRSLGELRFKHFAIALVPLALCLGFASVHLHHHTGRTGLVSENGSFNLVFGRCHVVKIESRPDDEGHGRVHFKPPPFLQIRNIERDAAKRGVEPEVKLASTVGEAFEYEGYIGDRDIHMGFIRECWKRTKWSGQLYYTWTNVKLLWLYNIPWPDSGRAAWRAPARWWTDQHKWWLATPALLGLLWILVPGRRAAKMGVVALNLLAVITLAAIFFGGARHRAPYDLVIIVLAFETYALLAWLALRGGRIALRRWWPAPLAWLAQLGFASVARRRRPGGPAGD